MNDSKAIVSISTDRRHADLPVADYGLEADLFAETPELVEAL